MLVSVKEQNPASSSLSPFRSPVVVSQKDDKSPTSGDVHLYIDPATAYGPLPLLYADCEGLDGGKTAPRATVLSETMRNHDRSRKGRLLGTQPRHLTTAKINDEAKNRDWAVREVHPRVLYTFSDVVVFVLVNPRAFESTVLQLMLRWASTSLEASVNQPNLPYAIIVLNATKTSIDEEEWDTETATRNLMQHVVGAVWDVKEFRERAESWCKKGRQINNMLDLLRCYYSDISVVRIPMKGRYMLANEQVNKLHQQIIQDCDNSFEAKLDLCMLCNTDDLNIYLQAGFDHFTTKDDEPFNFIDVAPKQNPVPRDFGDHILGIAANVREVTGVRDGLELFQKLSLLVASCIFTDCIKQHRSGKTVALFNQHYSPACSAALEHFCDRFWPCNFVSKKGKACANVKSLHTAKGHQSAEGKIIGSGMYSSRFSSRIFSPQWLNMISDLLQQLDAEFQAKNAYSFRDASSDTTAYAMHREHLAHFYISFNGFTAGSFQSLTSCFSCLTQVPQHPLQCGHTLCADCIRAYGRVHDRNSVVMDYCPLHELTTRKLPSCVVRFKPDFAGVRILTLDGEGMRGIAELEVLRAIERALGGKMSIQAFFDLIIGTSTGGIIALGLGRQWGLDHCVSEFVRLCEQAFTPRESRNIAGLRQAATLNHGSKHKSSPLHRALEDVFGEEELYGGRQRLHYVYDTKVAVTETSGTGQRALVLANYSRQEEREPDYRFEFPYELKTWEAAWATSAAPLFFNPFVSRNHRTYLDGTPYYNNPITIAKRERKLIWPDVADSPPDLILSLGTGQNQEKMAQELRNEMFGKSDAFTTKRKGELFKRAREKLSAKKPFKVINDFSSIPVNRVDMILDAERKRDQFCLDVQDGKNNAEDSSRYIRVNVDLGSDTPHLDEVNKLAEVQARTTYILRSGFYHSQIQNIAQRLIASSFYFSKDERIELDESSQQWTCTGKILCRFEGVFSDFKSDARSLGECLRAQQSSDFQPFFSIKNGTKDPDETKIELSCDMIEEMIAKASFSLEEPVEITVASQLAQTMIYLCLRESRAMNPTYYPISGFPRKLVTEDTLNATRLDKRAELIRERRNNALPVAQRVAAKVGGGSFTSPSHPDPSGQSNNANRDDLVRDSTRLTVTQAQALENLSISPQHQANLRPSQSATRHTITPDSDALAQLREQSHTLAGTTVQDAQHILRSESVWAEEVQNRDANTEPLDDDDLDGPPDADGNGEPSG